MPESPPQSLNPGAPAMRRRRLRAVFAADVANFGGMVSIEETRTLDSVWFVRRVATEELATHGGWLFGLPGDGIFALFESTVDAVRCALQIQARLRDQPKIHALKLRIGVHLGEVLFQDELPFGETLVIASRLESLAEPGGILVSAAVLDAVASHIAAIFSESGVPRLKHSARRIETFTVSPPPPPGARPAGGVLDRTVGPGPAIPRPPPASRLPPTPDADEIATSPPAYPLAVEPRAKDVAAPAMEAGPAVVPARGGGIDEASLRRLALLLTTHLGPMARVLVRRKAMENPDAAKLIMTLAKEIPTKADQQVFIADARASLAGVRQV